MKHPKLAVLAWIALAGIAAAQPPPLGPPPNRSETGGFLSIRTIQTTIENKIKEKLTDPRAKFRSITERGHFRTFTTALNRPNDNFVKIYFNVDIEVENPSFNRHIYLPLDVNVFCADWQTKNGKLRLTVVPGPPSIEGGSILEEVITIRDDIDAGVRAAFVAPLPVTENIPFACNTLGVGEHDLFWDKPITVPKGIAASEAVRVKPTIVVTFDRLKRLRARTFKGGLVYRESENVILNAFANYSQAQKILTMREGDDAALGLPPIELDARSLDLLVLIGSIEQEGSSPKDSAFEVATKAQGFAPGTKVLTIPKWYSEPPSQTNPKPSFSRVPGYELTYTVRYQNVGTLAVDPGGGVAPGGSTTGGTLETAPKTIQKAPLQSR